MIGILGGGQLSVFLIEAAHRLGYRVRVLLTDRGEPAASIADEVFIDEGPLPKSESKTSPIAFFQGLTHLLFESENIDLDRVEPNVQPETQVVPSFSAMRILQDKGAQKEFLRKLAVPTAPFEFLDAETPSFPKNWILKVARGGYDGKGNWLGTDETAGVAWAKSASARGARVYAEERVALVREIAVILARTAAGETSFYPAVVTLQSNGICDRVAGPAALFGLLPEEETVLRGMAAKIATGVDYVGTLAVEFFETHGGEFLVNEIAPRVHNSGHFTLEAAKTSQFEQHLRAALGLKLGKMETAPYFTMRNCLGPAGVSYDRSNAVSRCETEGRAIFHDYGKSGVRPGRKLGHLTVFGEAAERSELENEIAFAHRRWVQLTTEKKS